MTLLRRTLYAMAAVWGVSAIVMIAVPRWLLVDAFGQVPVPDYAWVRIAGVVGFCMAMLMVITAQRLEEMWTFTWAFVFAAAGTLVVALANAAWSAPDGSSTVLWWLIAATSLLFTVGLLAGLAKTGTERPVV
jgi:hypothetical protein